MGVSERGDRFPGEKQLRKGFQRPWERGIARKIVVSQRGRSIRVYWGRADASTSVTNNGIARGNCADRKRRRGERYAEEYIVVPTICPAAARWQEAVIDRPIIGQTETNEPGQLAEHPPNSRLQFLSARGRALSLFFPIVRHR